MSNIYLTHCTNKKDKSLERTTKRVTPDKLYTGVKIQRFMKRRKETGVKWAIFSDKYDVWFSNYKHEYYEEPPSNVDPRNFPEKFKRLVKNSIRKLKNFEVVYFYGNHKSHYFHHVYKILINDLRKHGINVVKICHLDQIIKQ